MYCRELNIRKVLKTSQCDNKNLEKIRVSKRGKNSIINVPNYEILSNPTYADSMLYTPIDLRDNLFEEFMSEFVAKFLYIGEAQIDIKGMEVETINQQIREGIVQAHC